MKNGDYILVVAPPEYPGKKYRSRYCYEHHLVWWKHTGQSIKTGMVVHHKDENKHNNAIENLEMIDALEHRKKHAPGFEYVTLDCPSCKKSFRIRGKDYPGRRRRQKNIFCSRQCVGRYYTKKLSSTEPIQALGPDC